METVQPSVRVENLWVRIILRAIEGFERVVLALGILAISVIIFLNVVFRYVFHISFSWAEEGSLYILIWITFVGMSYCVNTGAHVTMDVFFRVLPAKIQFQIRRLSNVVAFFLTLILAYSGYVLTTSIFRSGQLSSATGIGMWLVYLAVPVGSLLASRNYLIQILAEKKPSSEKAQRKGTTK